MGTVFCQIQSDKIDLNFWTLKLERENCGAITWFSGYVRKLNLKNEVAGITYEAHVPMAEKILYQICYDAQEKWDKELNFIVIHRIGDLKVGECSVLIGVASVHRAPAYETSRFVIEEIKKRVPIWKKEHYVSGDSQWLKGHKLEGQRLNEI